MNPAISREYHFGSLLKFAFPTIVMMIFMSLYTIVDGIFISRFIGTDALSATNIVYPVINALMAVAIMLATGGSAVVARKLGEGKHRTALENFSLIISAGVLAGFAVSAAGLTFLTPLCRFLGADESLLGYCRDYLGTLLLFAPACVLQLLFQTFFVTAGRPVLGLGLTILAGLTNAVLDYLLIVPLGMGVVGAALATAAGYLIPAVAGILFFSLNRGPLRFRRPRLDWRVLGQSCFNGSSEMVTNLSGAVITYLFNLMMLRYLGADGVAAITIVLYAQFLLTALYLGFSMGVAPVVSYNYGSGNGGQLRRLFKICLAFISGSSAMVYGVSLLLSKTLVSVFSPVGSAVYEISIHGFLLFSLSFLLAGFNIFASALFTALSDGKASAVISFLRTFVGTLLGLLVLPYFLQVDGVWLAAPFAELLTLGVSLCYFKTLPRLFHMTGSPPADAGT